MKRITRGMGLAMSLAGLWGCTIVVPQPLVPRPSALPSAGPGPTTPTGPGVGVDQRPVSRPDQPPTGLPPSRPGDMPRPWPGGQDPAPPIYASPPAHGGIAPPPEQAQVALDYVSSMAIAADGALYIMGEYDHLIWKRSPDGTLTRVAGDPERVWAEGAALDGAVATDVAIGNPEAVAVDAADRLLILAGGRVMRLEPDGRLKVLGGGWGGSGGYLLPTDGDEVLLMATYTWDTTAQLVSFAAGREPRQLAELDFGENTNLRGCGIDAQGRILGQLHGSPGHGPNDVAGRSGIIEIDKATGAFKPFAGAPPDAVVDARGVLYSRSSSGPLTAVVDGQAIPLGHFAEGTDVMAFDPRQRVAYVSTFYQVAAVDQGGARWVAGLPARGAIARPAEGFRVTRPGGIAAMPDGTISFADVRLNRIFQLDPDGSTVRGPEKYTGLGYGAAGLLRVDAQGRLWTRADHGGGLRCLDGGGSGPAGLPSDIVDFAFLANGDLLVSARPMREQGRFMQVVHFSRGKATVLIDESEHVNGGYSACFALVAMPGGDAWVLGRGRAYRWTAANGLGEPTPFTAGQMSFASEDSPPVALAPDGTIVVPAGGGLQRWSPADGSLTQVRLPFKPAQASGAAFARDGALLYLDIDRRRLVRVPAGQF